jgi:hypothetical protein
MLAEAPIREVTTTSPRQNLDDPPGSLLEPTRSLTERAQTKCEKTPLQRRYIRKNVKQQRKLLLALPTYPAPDNDLFT